MSEETVPTLEVVAIGDIPNAVLEVAANGIDDQVPIDTTVRSDSFPVELIQKVLHPTDEGQYRGDELLVLGAEPIDADLVLAVTDLDLTYRDEDFVFGVSEYAGPAGVVSINRLWPEDADRSASPSDPGQLDRLFRDRVRKAAIKQAGFLVGHEGNCSDTTCVYSYSKTVEDVDHIDETPSEECERIVKQRAPGVGDEDSRDAEPISEIRSGSGVAGPSPEGRFEFGDAEGIPEGDSEFGDDEPASEQPTNVTPATADSDPSSSLVGSLVGGTVRIGVLTALTAGGTYLATDYEALPVTSVALGDELTVPLWMGVGAATVLLFGSKTLLSSR